MRAERERARFRLYLVHKRTSLKCRVHALLFQHGVRAPAGELFGAGGRLTDGCAGGSGSESLSQKLTS